MRFDTAEQMLDYINDAHDLYSPENEVYVFGYNESGSIALYRVTAQDARLLSEEVENSDELYWSAFLGAGGEIYDDPSYELYVEGEPTNLDCCEELIRADDWVLVNKIAESEG